MPRLIDHGLREGKKAKKAKPKKPTRTKKAVATAQGPDNSYLYSNKIGEEICFRIAEGESLRAICRTPGMPSKSTIIRWGLDKEHPFADRYARARDIRTHVWAEESVDISDDSTNDYVQRMKEEGAQILVDHDHISRSRLRIETRKWISSKLMPRVYGDKIVHAGDDKEPINLKVGIGWMTEEQAKARGWA